MKVEWGPPTQVDFCSNKNTKANTFEDRAVNLFLISPHPCSGTLFLNPRCSICIDWVFFLSRVANQPSGFHARARVRVFVCDIPFRSNILFSFPLIANPRWRNKNSSRKWVFWGVAEGRKQPGVANSPLQTHCATHRRSLPKWPQKRGKRGERSVARANMFLIREPASDYNQDEGADLIGMLVPINVSIIQSEYTPEPAHAHSNKWLTIPVQ